MKLGLVIEEYQSLQTHLNLRSDLTGSLAKTLRTMSCGRSFFPCRRIKGCEQGSIVWDIFFQLMRDFRFGRKESKDKKSNKVKARICWVWVRVRVRVRLGLIDVFFTRIFGPLEH